MTTKCLSIILFTALSIFSVSAQTTEFTYQGLLNNAAAPANGNYDFEFLLFDAIAGGTQVGTTITKAGVAVTDGRFSVNLDFGAQFTGAERYLEIRVRPAGSGGYTILDPRQRVRSAPYSVKSLSSTTADNALNLGGVPAREYVTSPSGSAGFIQNTTAQQPSSNFNISGNGQIGGWLSVGSSLSVGNFVDVPGSGAYWLDGAPVLRTSTGNTSLFAGFASGPTSTGSGNSFFGLFTGQYNTSGVENSFFGLSAGRSNTTGGLNAFFGTNAGYRNTFGTYNTFIGHSAGYENTSGLTNSFFGHESGFSNTTGNDNTFMGNDSGVVNTTGSDNSFVGSVAGRFNTAGNSNTFVGKFAGYSNTTGSWNTMLGLRADVGSAGLANATAIGNAAYVTQSNSLVLGSINGVNGAAASTNVGIGTTAPKQRLHVVGGNIYIANPNSLVITSPNGACWFITVNNSGVLGANLVTCP